MSGPTYTSQYADQYGFAGGGLPNAQPWTSGPIVNTPSPVTQERVALAIGLNTFAVPPNTIWAKYVPDANGGIKTYKTVSGDTGTRGNPTNSWTWMFDPAALPANVYIVATAVESGILVFG